VIFANKLSTVVLQAIVFKNRHEMGEWGLSVITTDW